MLASCVTLACSNSLQQLQKYLDLPQKGNVMAEYVWIDGSNGIRSKSKVSSFIPFFFVSHIFHFPQPIMFCGICCSRRSRCSLVVCGLQALSLGRITGCDPLGRFTSCRVTIVVLCLCDVPCANRCRSRHRRRSLSRPHDKPSTSHRLRAAGPAQLLTSYPSTLPPLTTHALAAPPGQAHVY